MVADDDAGTGGVVGGGACFYRENGTGLRASAVKIRGSLPKRDLLMADQGTDIVELVKQRNPIEDVIEGDGYPLPKRGRYRKCTTAGTGGLVVDTQGQCYFWNSRSENGDVIAWVQRHRRVDFKQAVELLAERAALPAPNWGHGDHAARLAARIREEALDVAQRVFIRWLHKSDEAKAYVAERGWSIWLEEDEDEPGIRRPGTVVKAMVGYSGEGTEEERAEMRRELAAAGVDLDSPAAISILGFRGDVVSWSKRHDVQARDEWILGGYIPGMVGRKRLVYAHARTGRVVYLSGRSIADKIHFNLPEPLVGGKQLFFNQQYASGADNVVVVEGQADAITLGQWGIDAVALAGVAPGEELAELLKRHKVLYVGLDVDEAGLKNAWKVADKLGPLARLVCWRSVEHAKWRDGNGELREVKDANDLLRSMNQGGENDQAQRAFIRGLMEQAPTYVEQICEWAGMQEGARRDEAIPQALRVAIRLDEMKLELYRVKLAKALHVGKVEFNNLLKRYAAVEEKSRSVGEPTYTWGGSFDGWLVEYLYDIEHDRAMLAWRDPEGRIGSGDSVGIEGRLLVPYPQNETLRGGAIAFPSALGEKKSIRELVAYVELYLKSIYLLSSDKMARLISYWVLSTWLYDSFETVIYLRAMGGAGSGKSELVKRIGLVCYRTMTANGAGSTSSLFRAVERYKGVTLLDEADLQQSDTEADMIKFYNLGAMRGNPIWRTVEVTGPNGEKDWEERAFQTFCPKLIAMRKDFRDDAVGTRSLTLKLVPREMTELKAAGIPLTINQSIRARAQALRNLLLRWRLETWQPEIEVDPEFYDLTISPRLNQVAGPLLAIARDDPEQQEDIRQTLREYYAETIITQSMTMQARVIEAMWKIWNYPDLHKEMVRVEAEGSEIIKIGDVTRITNDIINEMNDEEDEGGDDGDAKKPGREVKSQRIGRIIRNELQLQVTTRRRDGFWVYWNGPRMEGLSTKFGINPADFGPKEGENGSKAAKQGPAL